MLVCFNMKKIIKLSESDLEKIIKKVLMEQRISNPNIQYSDTPSSMTSGLISSKNKNEDLNLISKYSCVPTVFRYPVYLLLKKGYNPLFIKTALGIIGRESDFGESNRFKYLSPLKTLYAYIGGQTSVGYGQVKPETASQFGMDVSDLNTAIGALDAVYQYVVKNYNTARNVGYNANPSSNFKDGTGNSALDISIVGFNAGPNKIVKYCETSNPELKRDCKLVGKTVTEQSVAGAPNFGTTTGDDRLAINKNAKTIKVLDKPVINYVPNFKTKRWDGVNISTFGYIKEVANNIKKYTCF